MAYPTSSPSQRIVKPTPPASSPRQTIPYSVADEPSRFSLRTLIVVIVSLAATGVSLYRIRDSMRQETPPPSPYDEFVKENPEYAELVSALRERDVPKAERALAKNPWLANFSRPESRMSLPLHIAAMTNQPEMIDLLLDRGADISAKGRWGATALHVAAWRGSADAVEALIHHGAAIEAKSENDASTPLFWACRGSREGFFSRNNHAAVVKILLDSGANPDIANSDGFPAVSIASEEIAALLVQRGASPRPAATQPTFGTMIPGERPWGYGFRYRPATEPSS